jgi:hypothetical protein
MQKYVTFRYVQDVLNLLDNFCINTGWWHISTRSEITWDIILNNPNKPWDFNGLSQNPNITINIIKDNILKKWNWIHISKNKGITWDAIVNNPELPWNWFTISQNPNITLRIIKENPDKPWNWYFISMNPNITWKIIEDNPDKPWDWNGFSKNPNITLKIIKDNPDKPLYLHYTRNANRELHWNLSTISIIWNFIKKSEFWNWHRIWNFLKSYHYKPLNWHNLSKHPQITFDIILNNSHKPWNWNGISQNPNITLQNIKDNSDKPWDWFYLSMNPNLFKFVQNDKSTDLITKWYAANVIKRRWFRCITDPAYVICRKRLICEFDKINKI